MNEHRRQILEMLSQGKITADEAERLIAALDKSGSDSSSSGNGAPPPAAKAKYLRILVDSDNAGDPHQGPVKVNIRVPMALLRAGVRLTGLIPPQARDHVNRALHERGIPFDLSQIKPDNLEELVDQLNELTVDVDVHGRGGHGDEKVKVRVFCE
jgi:SHOCT-like domain